MLLAFRLDQRAVQPPPGTLVSAVTRISTGGVIGM